MLAREKWQIQTIAVLERVFGERVRQHEKFGGAMSLLPDGIGPEAEWLAPVVDEVNHVLTSHLSAAQIQVLFREEYEEAEQTETLTRMHILREELGEALECDPDSPEFVEEILQVAALCVQWAEIKMEEQA